MAQDFKIFFKNEHIIYEEIIKCTVEESDFNLTYNPSILENKLALTSSVYGFTTASYFNPYVTTIGLYNDRNELLAVAKFGKPIPISQNIDTVFLIKFDK
jgi:hypothetical protein